MKKANIFIVLASLFAVLFVSGCTDVPIACTAEAKVCPDGSYVGRNPKNNCEFNPCPNITGAIEWNWQPEACASGSECSWKVCSNEKCYSCIHSSSIPPENRDPTENSRCTVLCTDDADCETGFSCWYQRPAGPSAGIKGTPEQPGWCINNTLVQEVV